jgi:hypothetical protein
VINKLLEINCMVQLIVYDLMGNAQQFVLNSGLDWDVKLVLSCAVALILLLLSKY